MDCRDQAASGRREDRQEFVMSAKSLPHPQQPVYQDERIKRPAPVQDILVTLSKLGMVFAKRPLVLGESEYDYDVFLSKVSVAVQPGDILETMWVKDIVDLKWEALRWRRAQASFLMKAAKQALMKILRTVENAGLIDGVQVFQVPDLLDAFAAGDDKAVAEVNRVLASRGMDMDMIMAQVLIENLDQLGPIERIIAAADARRSKVLQEIDRRRDAFLRRLRAAGAANPQSDITSPY
jgi:hypothetical protein